MAKMVTLLVPGGEGCAAETAARRLPAGLEGRAVGFLDNTKANFDVLAAGLGRVLREEFGVERVTIRRKANPAVPAPPELVAALAEECGVVLAGSGD